MLKITFIHIINTSSEFGEHKNNKHYFHQLFVQGRCARAGRSGVSYSLVSPDEYAFLLDLHLFLGRPLSITTSDNKNGAVGRIPRSLLEEQHGYMISLHENRVDLVSKVTLNILK